MRSQTRIDVTPNAIHLYRIIDSKMHTIEFSKSLSCANAAKYFDIDDATFIKMSIQRIKDKFSQH